MTDPRPRSRLQIHARALRQVVLGAPEERLAAIRGYQFSALALLRPTTTVTRGEGKTYTVHTRDQVIGREVFLTGGYGLATMRSAIRAIAKVVGEDEPLSGKVFIDVGANIGTSTVPALLDFGASRAIAYEPSPRALELLERNVTSNGLEGRVQVRALAVSDRDRVVTLEESADNFGDNRIVDRRTGPRRSNATSVRATSLDTDLSSVGVLPADVGCLWVDVQGHEPAVLQGASRLLAHNVPAVLEFWPDQLLSNGTFDLFCDLVAELFEVAVDVRARTGQVRQSVDVRSIAEDLRNRGAVETDLVLF